MMYIINVAHFNEVEEGGINELRVIVDRKAGEIICLVSSVCLSVCPSVRQHSHALTVNEHVGLFVPIPGRIRLIGTRPIPCPL